MSGANLFDEMSRFTLPKGVGRVRQSPADSVPPTCAGVVAFVNNWGLTNIDGVRKSADIIRRLASAFHIEVVFIDGAEGPAEFAVWDALHPLKREWFAEKLMLRGYLSPAELAVVLFPDLGIELHGIEDRELYRANWRAARKIAPIQADVVDALKSVRDELRNCASVLSVDTRELIERHDAYKAAYKNYSEAPDGQDDAEFDTMREKRGEWLSFLRLCLRWAGVSIPKTLADEMKRLGFPVDESLVVEVEGLVAEAEVLAAEAKNLRAEAGEWSSEPSLFLEELVGHKALSGLSHYLSTSLARTECDQAFLSFSRKLDMMIEAVNLKMDVEETTEFLQNFYGGATDLRPSVALLAKALGGMGITPGLELPPDIDTLVKAATEYHSLALLRGLRMAQTIARELERRHIDRAIVVQSGFQFPIIAGVLSLHYNIGTVQFVPTIEGELGESAYRARLLKEGDLEEEGQQDTESADSGVEDVGRASAWLQWVQAEFMEEWKKSLPIEDVEHLISRCRRDHRSVLIVDCGDGNLLLRLAQWCESAFVIGLENYATHLIPSGRQPHSLQRSLGARRLLKRTVLVNSLSRFLPFMDASFDLVVSDGLDRIFNAGESRAALRELVRVLKPEGDLRILTRKWADLFDSALHRAQMGEIERHLIDTKDVSGAVVLLEGKRLSPVGGRT